MAKMNSFYNLRRHSWKMFRSTPASYQKSTLLTCPWSSSEPGWSDFIFLSPRSGDAAQLLQVADTRCGLDYV